MKPRDDSFVLFVEGADFLHSAICHRTTTDSTFARKKRIDAMKRTRRLLPTLILALPILLAALSLQAGVSGGSSFFSTVLGTVETAVITIDGNGAPLHQRPDGIDTTLTLTDRSAPNRLYFGQNRPNPFRSQTAISYGLPYPTWVRISVLSIFGTPIRTIVDEPQTAGEYTIEFSGFDLAPGTYFYRIETDYGALTRRMTRSR